MNISQKTFLALAGCVLSVTAAGIAPAHAQEASGWNYTIDSFNDGSDAGRRGSNSSYEFYGLAIKETANRVYVALSSNLGLGGELASGADDGQIHYGDLFFNFTGEDLNDAQGSLFAVKFDAGNDSGVSEVGVYGNVVGQNVAKQNSGFKSMNQHRNWANKAGAETASMGDLDHREKMDDGAFYFQQGNYSVTNSIATGTFLGGIEQLDGGALAALGLNFQSVNAGVQGRNTFGFSFARDLMADGEYVAHLFAECINDGLAITGVLPRIEIPETSETVPEPAVATALLLVGGVGLLKSRQREANA
jgi:hypothetical protein